MKKIWLTLFFVFFLCSGYFAFAENITFDDVCSSLTEAKVTYGDFVQEKTSPKLTKPLRSSGKFIICDKGVVWAAEKPFKTSTVITDSSIIQTSPAGKKSIIDASQNEVFRSVASSISALFTGNKEALESNFTVRDFSSDSSSWKMLLLPKDKTISSAINEIELAGGAAGKKMVLSFIKILQTGGSSTTYTLSNQNYAGELTDEQTEYFN